MTQPYSCCQLCTFPSITHLCEMVKDIPGPAIEVGVWNGGTAYHLATIMPERKLYLVDTFTGIPYKCEKDNWFTVGYFGDAKVENVRKTFEPFPNVEVLQGLFPDDFRELFDKEKFAAVHLDVDVYKSYKDGLDYIYPRTADGGLIMLDDYKCHVCAGATIACDEFIAEKSIREVSCYNGKWYILKPSL